MKIKCYTLIAILVSFVVSNELYCMQITDMPQVSEDGELDFSNRGISDLSDIRDVLRDHRSDPATYIDLSHNNITRLKSGCLSYLPARCKEVNLTENNIKDVEAGALSGKQRGITFNIGGSVSLAPHVIAAIKTQVGQEQSSPRVLMRKCAYGLRFLSSPIGTLLWSLPLTIGLSYKYGRTKWWKAANIGFNAWCAKDAIKRRNWLEVADYTIDSLGQFNVPHHINNYMEQKTGLTLTPIERNNSYRILLNLLVGRLFFTSSRSPEYKPLAWSVRVASIPAMTNPSYNKLGIGNCIAKFLFFCFRTFAQRELIVKPIFSRLYNRLSGWISRTQNQVSTAAVGHHDECPVCNGIKRLSPFGECKHEFCASCIEGWRVSASSAGRTCPMCRGPETVRENVNVEEEQGTIFERFFNFISRTSW